MGNRIFLYKSLKLQNLMEVSFVFFGPLIPSAGGLSYIYIRCTNNFDSRRATVEKLLCMPLLLLLLNYYYPPRCPLKGGP